MNPLTARSRSPGFTLIEVLVSLAIFALAAVVLGSTYVNVLTGYDAVSRRNGHEQDLRLIRVALLAEPDRKQATAGGDLSLAPTRAGHWEATIEEAGVADLFQVTLHCEIRESADRPPWVHEEKFMLLRPTWSDPAIRDRLRTTTRESLERRRTP
jgi:general secretion pathway protein I